MESEEQSHIILQHILTNSVILRQTAPYIPIKSLLALGGSCKALREVILTQSESWRYLDLSRIRSALIDSSPIDVGGVSWRAERMDEALTEDDFYAGPLRGIFSRLHRGGMLRNVQTMVLDGLSVPADLVRDIVCGDRYNVKILSIREAKHLNETKLQQVLRYVVRPTRAEGTPKLRALYFFGPKDPTTTLIASQQRLEGSSGLGVLSSPGAQIGAEWNARSSSTLTTALSSEETKWYSATGRALRKPQYEWPDTINVCQGLIAFDAVLCRGPRHDIRKVASKDFLQSAIATIALGPAGCEDCGSSPEEPAVFGMSDEAALPLIGPAPTHSSTVRAAQHPQLRNPDGSMPKLYLRCEDCLRGRWCERCNRWWCEDCYAEPVSRIHQQTDKAPNDLQRNGWLNGPGGKIGTAVKVYTKLCVEHCLVSEMMSGAGSNGMWG